MNFAATMTEFGTKLWFAVRVPIQREMWAADFLERVGGLNVFLPIEHKWKRFNKIDRRRRQVAMPLLPRYLFVAFDALPVPWHKLMQFSAAHDGPDVVRSVVGMNGKPQPIPEPVMDHVRSMSALPLPNMNSYTLPTVRAGDIVRVTDGPLTAQDCPVRVQRVKGRKAYLILERPFLGQREVEVGVDSVEVT